MITEAQRHRLYTTFEEWIGEEANTLMDLLPSTGWADVATKQDLALLRAEMATKHDIAQVRGEIADLRTEFQRDLRESHRSLLFGMVTAMAANSALVVTLISLIR